MSFPSYMNKAEQTIIASVIHHALAANCYISVNDGEEWTLKKSRDRNAIKAECAATDMTTFLIRNVDGDKIGRIMFVHGNGCDVIADYSDNEHIDEIVSPAMQVTEKFQNM